MSYIFDINAAKLYDSWYQSTHGKALEKLVNKSLVTLLDPQPGERVLDIGCGEGNHLLFLSKLGLNVSGVDASPYMISRAKERLGHTCTLKTGFAEELPFDDDEFDLAVLINTLEFLKEPVRALREAGRVAKRRVFLGTANTLSWHYMARKIEGLYRDSIFNHSRPYHLWELKALAQAAFGDIPIQWQCAQIWPGFLRKIGGIVSNLTNLSHCPFGSFIGLSVSILYWVKTEQQVLKIPLKKAEQSIANSMLMSDKKRPSSNELDSE